MVFVCTPARSPILKVAGDLAALARPDDVLRQRSGRASARGMHRSDFHRFVAGVLVFEMRDRRLVGQAWMQVRFSRLPREGGTAPEPRTREPE